MKQGERRAKKKGEPRSQGRKPRTRSSPSYGPRDIRKGSGMYTICLFGAGKIGEAITALLSLSGRYFVKVCDQNIERAQELASKWSNCEAHALDLSDPSSCISLLQDSQAVLSALPYFCNVDVAQYALKAKVHYFDLTEDVATTRAVNELALGANVCFMPQCGLAPGFISIAAEHLLRLFDQVESCKMRVGALPLFPTNRLKYCLTWSTEGLINEYCNPCEIIEQGRRHLVMPLEGYEMFSLDGVEYEAFNTSGGLGSLAETYEGRIRSLDYKTIRYPGHRDLVSFLLNDLKFIHHRSELKQVFERSIATTDQDKCIIFVEVKGAIDGKYMQKTYASTVPSGMVGGKHFTAIQLTTAAGICSPLDLVMEGKISHRGEGILRAEDVPLGLFLNNEFGRYYRDERALGGLLL